MEFRLLGSLEVTEGGALLDVGGAKHRALLAILLLHVNQVVPTDRLADKLWGGEPPPGATATLQSYVSSLRRALAPGRRAEDHQLIVTRRPGYLIQLGPEQLDVTRFETLVAEAHQALVRCDWARAASFSRRALELWRGSALADFTYEPFAQAEAARLEEARLRACEHRVEADLALGRHADVVGELETLVTAHPLREGLWAHLMTALYRCGRQAEALHAYQRVRQALGEDLGIDPGPALQRLERGILRQEEWLELPSAALQRKPETAAVLPSAVPTEPCAPAPGAPTFVGRTQELAVLEAELARVMAGESRCVLVTGEAGVGKTRLATELLGRHTDDVVALSGRGYHLGLTASFSVWAEALERHLRRLPEQEVIELCGGFLDDLASLLRSVAALRGSVPEREPPWFRLLQGLALLLVNLAEQRPLVIVLDDVHLADASSWDELQYLIRNVPGARLLVLAAARPAELAEQTVAAEVVLGLEQEGLLTRLEVKALERESMGELAEAVVGQAAPPALVDWVAERSKGNTLFALGLLRALLDEGGDLSAPVLQRLPESLAERVTGRLRGLDRPTVAVLELLAVLGRRVDLPTLLTLSGQPFDSLERAVARLVGARLVVEEEWDRDVTYEITHPLIQEAIYTGISGARRRAAHRAVGRALVTAGRLGEAAGHFACSAHMGDDEAITALRDAVREAERREAYREAVTILSALAEILPSGDDRWLDVAGVLSRQADWVYRPSEVAAMSIRALREIQAVLERSPDPACRATISFRLATFLAYGTGELEEAERACTQAIELYRTAGDLPRRLVAANELAAMRGLQGDLAAWQSGCQAVTEAAEAAGEYFPLVQALGQLGAVAAHRGRFREAEAALRRNLAFIRQDRKPHRRTRGLTLLAYCLAGEGRVVEALPLLEEAKAENPGWRESTFLELGIMVSWMAGDLPAVVANADEIGPVGRRSAHAMHFAALSAADTGQLHRARGYLARAEAAYGDGGWFFYPDYGRYVDALVAWRAEPAVASLATLRRVSERLMAMEVLPYAAWVMLDLAEMAAAGNEPDLASWAARRLEEVAQRIDRPLYWGIAGIGATWSSLVSTAPDRAPQVAGQAVNSLSGTGCRAFLGRAFEVLGRSLLGVDPVRAEEALEQAATLFEACGASWRHHRVEALPRPVRPRASSGVRSRSIGRRHPEPVAALG